MFSSTLQELVHLLKEATRQMKTEVDCSVSSVTSGCALFLQFITLQSNKLEEGVIKKKKLAYIFVTFNITEIIFVENEIMDEHN